MVRNFHRFLFTELEVHDVVSVKVTSKEDRFAIKVLNLLTAVTSLLSGEGIRREVPIFGAPFHLDVFMFGLIDEIRGDAETFQFDIFELKTRQRKTVPGASQKVTHDLQVMLYKQLFDDLISGKTTIELIEKHMRLDADKQFGLDVMSEVDGHKFSVPAGNLRQLFKLLVDTMSCMPRISQLYIEYCYQEDESTIEFHQVRQRPEWFKQIYKRYIEYWRGERGACGVDIEDAWKCHSCDYNEICEWRRRKSDECRANNKIHIK